MAIDHLAANKTYAKVSGDTILEFPVSYLHIQNRGEPIEWYVEVNYDAPPVVPEFHYAREVPRVVTTAGSKSVQVSYQVEALTLSGLLSQINPQPMAPSDTPVSVNIADVSLSAVERIKELTTAHVQQKLDEFAHLKGYDGILSATSYSGSTNAQFATEAAVALSLRDQAWGALYTYLNAVIAGTQPVPATVADIEAQLPAFVWP